MKGKISIVLEKDSKLIHKLELRKNFNLNDSHINFTRLENVFKMSGRHLSPGTQTSQLIVLLYDGASTRTKS